MNTKDLAAPKRGRPIEQPSPEQIKDARGALTQTEAAALVHVKLRTWQGWEGGESRMPLGLWELLLIKVGRRQP